MVELNSKIFALEKIKPEIVHEVATSLRASRRQSIAHTKTRGEVRGGGKKPWQQKGTGRARAGSIRSPLWRGGGITFGPRSNRNWERKINKKMKTLGLFSILTDKAKTGQLVVVDGLKLNAPKTKELAAIVKDLRSKLPALGKRQTLVVSRSAEIIRAGRNLADVKIMSASSLDILELLSRPGLIVAKEALPVIEKTFLKAGQGKV